MTDQWKQICDLYDAALKLPVGERAAFLQTCIASDDVRRELASLLANERTGEHLLESPALEVAARMTTDNAPVLTIGQTLGHYKITSQLGKGGMGEVYRAHDGKLGRDVAIKTLPPEFALDPERVARFKREAKLLASLNHPNIAAIYGLEESGGTNFLVLELAEGPTLADRIKAGPIPIEESLNLALQIAEALEAAHEKGVIHRDLKPANIKVTPEGKVKVLDFGLAKAFAGEQAEMNLSNSPTLSDMATRQGVILGTAAYMSPEQARGKAVDKRADIWAFGCVLFEMLTGRAAFQGEDVTEILASVVKGGVNLDLLPANLHPRVREAITRCLQKDLRRRYQGMADASYEIGQALAIPGGVVTQPVATTQSRKGLRTTLPWIAAAAILGVIVGGFAVWKSRQAEPRQVTRFDYELPEGRQFSNLAYHALAVSPDGKQIVHSTPDGLYVRSLSESTATLIPGAEGNAQEPFFSPDGKWIGYLSASKLKKIAPNGGPPAILCDAGLITGGWWNEDNTIVYSHWLRGVMRISADGGTPESIVEAKSANLADPQILPDGNSILYTSRASSGYRIMVQSLKSGVPQELFPGFSARYLPTGHLIYMLPNSNDLFAVRFNLEKLKAEGGPVSVVEGVRQYAISASGTLAYISGASGASVITSQPIVSLVWVNRDGREEPLSAPPDVYWIFRISPDGTKVALTVGANPKENIYIWDITREIRTRLTFDEGTDNINPLWTPDGKRILYCSSRENATFGDIYWKAADGTGVTEKLASSPGRGIYPYSWSKDGKTLVLWELTRDPAQTDIGMLSMEGDHARKGLLQEKYNELWPQVSPDGRWMAYVSSESGKGEICVRPFPDVNKGRWQVSTDGGNSPLWSPDGREIFYRKGDATMVVRVEAEPTFNPGKPTVLFSAPFYSAMGGMTPWDISPDGKRFLMLKEAKPIAIEVPRKINVVINWFEELKQRVPVK